MLRRRLVAVVLMLCTAALSVQAFSRNSMLAARPLAVHFSSFRRVSRLRSPKGRTAPAMFAAPVAEKQKLQVVLYPHPALRAENKPVAHEEFNTQELAQLCDRLLQAMYEEGGVGLAAPQVGINKRIMVWNQTGLKDRWYHEQVMINPTIVQASDEMRSGPEMCLSFPGVEGTVERHKWIEVEWQDLIGRKERRRFKNNAATVFQHEYDHLDGVLFIDKLNKEDRDDPENCAALDKLIAHHGPGGAL